MSTVAVVLAGCGVFDGSEINEVVLTLLALEQTGLKYQALAPARPQRQVTDHVAKQAATSESRSILIESARIVRGDVLALDEVSAEDFQAMIVPGGFGAAQNLCDFASHGCEMTLQADFLHLASAFVQAKKPMGLMCIAPVMVPHLYGKKCKMTIGSDADVISQIMAMGGTHIACAVDEIVIDEAHKVVTTPAYMLARSISEAKSGIDKLVTQVANWLTSNEKQEG